MIRPAEADLRRAGIFDADRIDDDIGALLAGVARHELRRRVAQPVDVEAARAHEIVERELHRRLIELFREPLVPRRRGICGVDNFARDGRALALIGGEGVVKIVEAGEGAGQGNSVLHREPRA